MIFSSRIFVFLCTLFFCGITSASEAITSTGSGTVVKDGNLTILNLHGSWEDMGKQYGELMITQLSEMDKEFYSRYYEFKIGGFSFWVGRLTNNFFYYAMESILDRREKQFLRGAAASSGIPYQRLVILDLLPYLFTLNEASNGEHCSFVSVNGNLSKTGQVLIGRNMDYDTQTKEILNYVTMVVYHPNDGSNTVATFGFLGFIPGHTIVTKNGLFLESNDGSYSSPVNSMGMVSNLLKGKLDVLHRDFYASLDAHSVEDVVKLLGKNEKLSLNLSSSFTGVADSNQVLRLENPAGGGLTAQPKMLALAGQKKDYNFFSNLYTQAFPTAVLTMANCVDKTNDSPSYACARYHNIEHYLQSQDKIDLQALKTFMLTPIDDGGVYQTGESINHPVDEISLQSIACDMSKLECFYRDFSFNPNEWKQIKLDEYFDN